MSQLNIFNFKVSLPAVIIFGVSSFLIQSVLSAESNYEICNPKTCGSGPKISYPFHIFRNGTNFCGHPGFKIRCKDGMPFFKTYSHRYIIQSIDYENQSFRLVNFHVMNTTCPAPRHNYTFNLSSLNFMPNHADIYFFYNCTDSFYVNYTKSLVNCSSSAINKTFVALVPRDEGLNWTKGTCGSIVAAPVQLGQGEVNETITDVDYTKLLNDGFTLKWDGLGFNCSRCLKSGGQCGFEEDKSVCYCLDGTHPRYCNDGKNKLGLIALLVASGTGIGVLMIIVYWFRKKISSNVFCCNKEIQDCKSIDIFLKNYGPIASKRYSYSEVKKMTESFKDKLGQGGFGGVFKGKLPDGRLVAVKMLKESRSNGEEFINEIASISKTSHVNVVTLLGFCFEGSRRALIYEFMSNGSLDKYIHVKNLSRDAEQLGWQTLYQIVVGIARGLEYLHRGCNTRILHFDIKPHNILLDENFCPKISDFGLAKICQKKESIVSMLGARGTVGYIAPEVYCRKFGGVSHKSDVYSYGMLVLEMVGARNKNVCVSMDHTSEIYFPDLIWKRLELGEELELGGISNEEENQVARKMIMVSLWCIQTNPSNRPSMSRAVEMLLWSLESMSIPPRPCLSSPPISPLRLGDSSLTTTVTMSM